MQKEKQKKVHKNKYFKQIENPNYNQLDLNLTSIQNDSDEQTNNHTTTTFCHSNSIIAISNLKRCANAQEVFEALFELRNTQMQKEAIREISTFLSETNYIKNQRIYSACTSDAIDTLFFICANYIPKKENKNYEKLKLFNACINCITKNMQSIKKCFSKDGEKMSAYLGLMDRIEQYRIKAFSPAIIFEEYLTVLQSKKKNMQTTNFNRLDNSTNIFEKTRLAIETMRSCLKFQKPIMKPRDFTKYF